MTEPEYQHPDEHADELDLSDGFPSLPDPEPGDPAANHGDFHDRTGEVVPE